MPLNPQFIYSANMLQPAGAPGRAHTLAVAIAANQMIAAGTVLGEQSTTAANAEQTVTIGGSPTGGTFTLSFGGNQTAPLAYNISTASLTAALAALANIGAGNVSVTGTPGSSYAVSFVGAMANEPQPLITATSALTGGTTPSVSVANTTTGQTGIAFAPYNNANSDGTQTAKALAVYDMATDDQGNITFGSQAGGDLVGATYRSAPVFYCGLFNTSDLVGLDANGVADLGRLVQGTLTAGLLEVS